MKPKNPTKGREARWLLPEAAGWTCGPLGGAGRTAVPAPGQEQADGVVWPLGLLAGLPAWVAGGDPSLFPGAVALEWEKRGLLPRHYHRKSLVVREVAKEGGKTLVLGLALARQAGTDDTPLGAEHYISLLDAVEWPADRLVLFRERGMWAAVVTRGRHPVYFAAFHSGVLPEHAPGDLACMLEALRREGCIGELGGVVLWDGPGAASEAALRQALGLPLAAAARPAWRPESQAPALLHPAVVLRRQQQGRKRSFQRAMLAGGAVLALLLVLAGGRVAWAEWEVKQLEAQHAALETEAAPVRASALRWRRLEASIDPVHFPLEHLRAVAEMLPANGVRLTEFQWKDGQVRLTGEAQDTTMAFAYAESLKKHEAFAWEMEPPSIQPNNSAQFVIRGRAGR